MKRNIIDSKATLLDALGAINELSGQLMTLIVTGDDGRMVGTLTDGDIRRALIAGHSLDACVTCAMQRSFRYLDAGNIDVAALASYRRKGIRMIPVLDADGRVVRVLDTSKQSTLLPVRAIVMAGGRGERLRPMTLTTPKPLLKVGDRAIIDYNISMLADAGITYITVTTHYLAEQIEAHFAEAVCGVKVKCVREVSPLGTIGAVSLADIPDSGTTLVMNSDLLTTLSLEEMWLHHRDTEAMLTVAAIPYTISVPYAILETDGCMVKSFVEKPSYTHHANAGIYLIDNALLRQVRSDTRTDATDLIESALAQRMRVSFFPINGTWIDIGAPNDYARAQELMRYHSGNKQGV